MSNNGYYMVVPSGNNYKFYNASSSQFMGTLNAPSPTDAAFASDSINVFLASGTHVYKVRYDSLLPSTVVTDTKNVMRVATSSDGNTLAYVAQDPTLSTCELVGINLTTNAEIYRVALAGLPYRVAFTPDNTKIVVDGPQVFDAATGANLLPNTDDSGPFALAKDGSYTVEWNAATPTLLESRNLADGSVRWSITPSAVTNYTGGNIAITYNGDRVLIPGRNAAGKAAIYIYKTADGSYVSTVTPSLRTDTIPNPTTSKVSLSTNKVNYVVALSQEVPSASDAYLITETVNLFDNSTASRRNETSPVSGAITSMFETKANVLSGAPLAIFGSPFGLGDTVGNVTVRNADTGALVRAWAGVPLISNPGAVGLSTDGAYAALCTTNGLTVNKVSTGASLGTVAIDARSVAWIDGSTLVVSAGDKTLKQYSVSSGTPVLVKSVNTTGVSPLIAVNPAGTIAVAIGPGAGQFTRLDIVANTIRIYTTTLSGQVTFADFDGAGYAYIGQHDTGTAMNLRKWDLTNAASPVGMTNYSRTFPTAVDSAHYSVSPDSKFLIIGASFPKNPSAGDLRTTATTYLINPVTTGNLITWSDQQVGGGISAMAISPTSTFVTYSRKDPAMVCISIPSAVSSVSVAPNPATGGNVLVGTATMTTPTPGALSIFLRTSNTALATVPTSVVMPANATSANFNVTTFGVDSPSTVTITAYTSLGLKSTDVVLNPASPSALTVAANLYGASATGTVTLNGKAGPSGVVVSLTSDNAAAVVPATVTVPSGATSANFTLTLSPVTTDTPVNFTATANGATANASSTIKPNIVTALSIGTNPVCSGSTVTGTVTLAGPAQAGGEVVTLSSSSTNATVPATITVPAGATTKTFSITTLPVATNETDTITATLNGGSANASFDLHLPGVKSLVLTRTSVVGGTSGSATLTLTGKVNAPVVINLTSSNSGVASVPATVTVPANTLSVVVTITTTGVSTNTVVTITASRETTTSSQNLTVTPPR